jgi:hypothetical protein
MCERFFFYPYFLFGWLMAKLNEKADNKSPLPHHKSPFSLNGTTSATSNSGGIYAFISGP